VTLQKRLHFVFKGRYELFGWPIAETPFPFFEKERERNLRNAIIFPEVTFRLLPFFSKPYDLIGCRKKAVGMIDPLMMKICDIQGIAAKKAIGIDNAIRDKHLVKDRKKIFLRVLGITLAHTLQPRLRRPKTRILPAAPRPRFPLRRSQSNLLPLDFTGHWRDKFQWLGNDVSESMIKQAGAIRFSSNQFLRRPGRCPTQCVRETSKCA